MTKIEKVEFRTFDGTLLKGNFFTVDTQNAPIIVMTQGLSLLKEHYIDSWARRFQAVGIACLVYDHRGWGSSSGWPPNQVDPIQQAEDYHDAVAFAACLPSIDPRRIAIWGIGHSGGAAMMAAGNDPRVKVVVLVIPFNSGKWDAKNFPPGILDRSWADRAAMCEQQYPDISYAQVWDNTREEALQRSTSSSRPLFHGLPAYEFYEGAKKLSDAAGTP